MKQPPKPKAGALRRIALDISGYDRSTIIWEIRSAYLLGYDEIAITFRNDETHHLRKAGRVFVREVVTYTASRLLGVRVEIPNAKTAILRIPTTEKYDNMQELTKRISKMMVEMHQELMLLMKGHLYAASLIEEKHDSISKLVSYVKRYINTMPLSPASTAQYHFFATIDKVADIIKYISRDYIKGQYPLSKTTYTLFMHLHECVTLCEQAINRPNAKDIIEFSIKRDDVKRFIREATNVTTREQFLLGQATTITELLIDMMESKMAVKNALK